MFVNALIVNWVPLREGPTSSLLFHWYSLVTNLQTALKSFGKPWVAIKGAFFLTGNFLRIEAYQEMVRGLAAEGHYVGAHSNNHLLYCDWTNRDSLLVSKEEFVEDLAGNYQELERLGVAKDKAFYYLPPYEWYNATISDWTSEWGLQLINYSPGTISHADYTTPEMSNYRSSETIFQSILTYESAQPNGLNGFVLLSHIGVDPARTDKFYHRLDELIVELQSRSYRFKRIDELLK